MWVLPHGRSQYNFDFHASTHRTNLSVAGRFSIHTKIGKMFLHTFLSKLLCHQASHGSLSLIFALHKLDESHFHQSIFLNPVRVGDVLELPLHFILVSLLFLLLTTVDTCFRGHSHRKISRCFLGIFFGISTPSHITTCDIMMSQVVM